MRTSTRWASVALGAAAIALAALGAGAGAQTGPTRTVDAGDLTFQVPGTWQEVRTTFTMRKAQLRIPEAEGDPEPGELAVFAFPGGAGTVESNIQRWQNQFRNEAGQSPKADTRIVAVPKLQVTRVALAGTFTDPFAGRGAQPNFRLLGAIAETPGVAYFIKLVGPDKTIRAAEADFDKLIATLKHQSQ